MNHVFIIKIVGISFALAFLVYQLYLLLEFSGVKTPLKHKILSVFAFLFIIVILFLTIISPTE